MPQFVMEPTHLAEQVSAELQNMGYRIVQNGSNICSIMQDQTPVGTLVILKDPMYMRDVVAVKLNGKDLTIKDASGITDLVKLVDEKEVKAVTPAAETIIVQYQHEDTKRLEAIEKGDWIDLYADETVEIKQGEMKLVNLGVAMKLPAGYEGHLAPRSSTFKKWGVIQANSVGVVDNSYCGPNDWWRFPAVALRDTVIERGDKICQFRIVSKQPIVKFVEGKMESEDRGGFGSTGST